MAQPFLLPPDYQAQLQDVERQRRLAQVLQQQGMQPLESRKAGRFVVVPSPLEGLAKVMQSYAGAQAGKQADVRTQDIVRQAGEARSNTLAQALAKAQGVPEIPQPPAELGGGPGRAAVAPDPLGAYSMLAQSGDPMALQAGGQMLGYQRQVQEGAENRAARESAAAAARQQQMDMAKLTASLKPGPQPKNQQVIQTDQGPMILQDDGSVKPISGPGGTQVKPPIGKGGQMSATAQKELIETEEQIQGGQSALNLFKQAKALNEKAMGFTGAGMVASAGSMLPQAIRPGTVEATQNLDNILQTAALPQLKAIFGGMPTEGERKILLDVQGSSSKPANVRKDIFDRAEKAIQARIKFAGEKAKRLREGTYFTGEGLPSLQNPGANPPPTAPNSPPPRGVDAAVWGAMTPEERALWPKD